MKKLILLVAITFLTLTLSAQPGGKMIEPAGVNRGPQYGMRERGPEKMEMMRGNVVEKLGLTEDQINKIRIARMEMKKKMIKQREAIRLDEINMAEEMIKDNPNEKRLRNLATDIGRIKGNMAFDRVTTRLVMNKYLTKEQIQKLRTLRMKDFGIGRIENRKGKEIRGFDRIGR